MSAGKKILVVDDDPDIVETTKAILETEGYQVLTAADGTEGLAKAREAKPDLMILDVMMDRETEGFHVSYELKKDEKTKAMPIIMLTAIGAKSGFKFSAETDGDYLPVEAFLEKPLEPKKLLETVAEFLAKKG